jgi:hypothetical protein
MWHHENKIFIVEIFKWVVCWKRLQVLGPTIMIDSKLTTSIVDGNVYNFNIIRPSIV